MKDYIAVNQKSWDAKVQSHFDSEFYDVKGFLEGKSTLNSIELELLGNIKDKSLLHLQCHMGQDSISLARMGAKVTGVDFSEEALIKGRALSKHDDTPVDFINSDIYSLPQKLDEKFDIVFTSYGTIGWLPDINKWAEVVAKHLKNGGAFIMAEFHPVLWMFDDDFTHVAYKYANDTPIIEELTGSYAAKDKNQYQHISWNHGLAEVFTALLKQGINIEQFNEHDYSPYNAFPHSYEVEPGKFRLKPFGDKIPIVYAIRAIKQ